MEVPTKQLQNLTVSVPIPVQRKRKRKIPLLEKKIKEMEVDIKRLEKQADLQTTSSNALHQIIQRLESRIGDIELKVSPPDGYQVVDSPIKFQRHDRGRACPECNVLPPIHMHNCKLGSMKARYEEERWCDVCGSIAYGEKCCGYVTRKYTDRPLEEGTLYTGDPPYRE